MTQRNMAKTNAMDNQLRDKMRNQKVSEGSDIDLPEELSMSYINRTDVKADESVNLTPKTRNRE